LKIESVRRIEFVVAILLTAVVLILLGVRAVHAGALWRDECGSVQLAQMPAFADIFENFAREAFPVPFPAALRAYSTVFGTSDAAFRTLGFAVGVLLLIVIWHNSRLLSGGPPLLLLVLLGLNATFLTWGTSLRAYGIGSVFILLAFALIAKMLLEPTWFRIAVAFLASLVSVQLLLYNSVLLAAIGVAVIIVSAIRRMLKPALAMTGIGLLCAGSMLPYLGAYYKGTQWNMLQKGPLTFSLIWNQLALGFGDPWNLMTWVWPVLFFAIIGGASAQLYFASRSRQSSGRDLFFFGMITIAASIIGYYAFLKALSYGTRPWYYLALLSVLAGTLDLLVIVMCQIAWIRVARLAFVSVAFFVLPFADWPSITERVTNIDLVAKKLGQLAGPNDLIIVNPWWLGISFTRYYHGPTRWETLPTMNDHQIHRFDLVKAKMVAQNPIDDLRDMIGKTLQSGRRVWFVGGIGLPEAGVSTPQLPDRSDTAFRWNSDVYCDFWSAQLGAFLQMHMLGIAEIPEPAGGPVNPLEDVPLLGVEGWKE
jgi:hypothetical protein